MKNSNFEYHIIIPNIYFLIVNKILFLNILHHDSKIKYLVPFHQIFHAQIKIYYHLILNINKAQEKYQSSRKQNQDLKSQVVKEVTETTSVNRRNAGNQPTVTTTKTVTTVNQNQNTNSRNQIRDSNSKKEKKKVYSSLTVSTTNKLNVRDSQNNRVSGRNSSSSRKKEDNLIQVKKSETLIKNNQKNIIFVFEKFKFGISYNKSKHLFLNCE